MISQFLPDPFSQQVALGFRGLLFFLRRHLAKEDLLLHAIQQIQPRIQREARQVIQPDISLVLIGIVAGRAVVFQQGGHFIAEPERFCRSCGSEGIGCHSETEDEAKSVARHHE